MSEGNSLYNKKEQESITFEKIDSANPLFNRPESDSRQSYLNLIRAGGPKPVQPSGEKSPTNRYLSQNGFAHQQIANRGDYGPPKNNNVFSDRGPLPNGMAASSQSIPVENNVNGSPQTIGRKSMGVSGSEYQRRRLEPLNGA